MIQAYSWRHHVVAVSPGEPGRPVAVSVVGQVIGYDYGELRTQRAEQVHLEEIAGGTSLDDIAARVGAICTAAKHGEETNRGVVLIVDTSIMGNTLPALLDGYRPVRAAVTNRAEEGFAAGVWTLPRRDLAGQLLLWVQRGMLRTASTLPLATRFGEALQRFKIHTTAEPGEDALAEVRREADDGLVLAAALALWQVARETPREWADRQAGRVLNATYDPWPA
jgi:hypothetical protein